MCIQYNSGSESTLLMLGEDWRVQPSEELLSRLRNMLGEDDVRLVY